VTAEVPHCAKDGLWQGKRRSRALFATFSPPHSTFVLRRVSLNRARLGCSPLQMHMPTEMAHEIGHLLLGTNAHSPMGIMRPNWQGQELRSIGMGTLLFTPDQGRSMQTKLFSLTARN
jgi:hypothetical protein